MFMIRRGFRANIPYNYFYTFFSFFGVTTLWVLYLTHKGMSLVEVGLLESIFHVASFIFEMPTGALADRFGYRTVLVFGRICAALSSVIMIFSHDFLWFAIGFVISALSYNLNSGTNEALVYESLHAFKAEKTYINISANLNAIYEFTDTLGVFVAGWFVNRYFEGVYWIQIAVSVLAIVTVLLMSEPEKPVKQEKHRRDSYAAIIKRAVLFLKENKQLRFLMVYFAFFQGVLASFYFYFQSLMNDYGFKGYQISILMVISAVFQIVGAKISPRIEKRMKQAKMIQFFSALLCLMLLISFVNQPAVLIVCFVSINTLSALSQPIFSNYFNLLIPSGSRATLLSVSSMLFSVAMIVLFPFAGWLVERIGFSTSFGLLGIVLLISLIVLFFFRNPERRPKERT